MASEIQVGAFILCSNGNFSDTEQPAQVEVTQNAVGFHSDITSIAVAEAGTAFQGTVHKPSAACATTAALAANTYANGASGVGATLTANANGALGSIDGYAIAVGELILVKDEASGLKKGLYTVTALGDGGNPYVLTRSTAMDTTGEFVGATIYVANGTTNGATNWNCTNASAPTLGTTAITFAKSTAGTAIGIGNLTTLGWAFLQNLDSTNFIVIGVDVGGYLQPIAKLKATEYATVRLYPGVTYRAVADTATCNLKVKIFQD